MALKIREIRENMDGVYVVGKVIHKTDTRLIETKFGPALFAQAILEDETGRIQINLYRDQTRVNVGDKLSVENGFTKYGELNVGKRGRVMVIR